jgi:hypothetical protein
VAAVLFVAALGSGAAQAWWDDSHGYRGVRAYAYGPPYRTGYFSGVTIRVDEWRYRHHLGRHRPALSNAHHVDGGSPAIIARYAVPDMKPRVGD